MNWNPQVNQPYALHDGRKPEDFRFDQWPVTGARLRHRAPGDQLPASVALVYRCNVPAGTPQTNQYRYESGGYVAVPDPTGMVLSSVKFQLIDPETHTVLDEDESDHVDGRVTGLLGDGAELWQRLQPGDTLRVKLVAFPLFYFLAEDGGVQAQYAIGNQGYFKGAVSESRIYVLSMDPDGTLLLDGQEAPLEPEPAPVELTPEEIELQAQVDRERAEYEKQRIAAEEQKEAHRAEIRRAKAVIYSRRGDYDTAEDWLLGVLFDKTLDFNVRKRVYLVAKEVGFDVDAARRRRADQLKKQEEAERQAARDADDEAALEDGVKLFYMFFDQQGAGDLETKAALLRKIYNDPQWDRYDAAAVVVAKELGVTL